MVTYSHKLDHKSKIEKLKDYSVKPLMVVTSIVKEMYPYGAGFMAISTP